MEITRSQTLPARPDVVFGVMCTEALQRAKARDLGALDFSFETGEVDGAHRVRSHRTMPTTGVAEFVKALVTPTLAVVETEDWEPTPGRDGSRTGLFTIDVGGAPVEFHGRVDLVPVPDGTRLTFSGTWSATAPLFRSTIESVSASSVTDTMEAEFRLLANILVETQNA